MKPKGHSQDDLWQLLTFERSRRRDPHYDRVVWMILIVMILMMTVLETDHRILWNVHESGNIFYCKLTKPLFLPYLFLLDCYLTIYKVHHGLRISLSALCASSAIEWTENRVHSADKLHRLQHILLVTRDPLSAHVTPSKTSEKVPPSEPSVLGVESSIKCTDCNQVHWVHRSLKLYSRGAG